MPNIENETTIQFNDGEPPARIWSCQFGFHAKMKRLGVEPTRIGKRDGGAFSAWYIVPKSWIHIRPPRKSNLTEEQRAAAGERLKHARLGHLPIAEQGDDDPEE